MGGGAEDLAVYFSALQATGYDAGRQQAERPLPARLWQSLPACILTLFKVFLVPYACAALYIAQVLPNSLTPPGPSGFLLFLLLLLPSALSPRLRGRGSLC